MEWEKVSLENLIYEVEEVTGSLQSKKLWSEIE